MNPTPISPSWTRAEREAWLTIQEEAKETLGEPDKQSVTRLEGITDLERLRRIRRRAMKASSWQELLDPK